MFFCRGTPSNDKTSAWSISLNLIWGLRNYFFPVWDTDRRAKQVCLAPVIPVLWEAVKWVDHLSRLFEKLTGQTHLTKNKKISQAYQFQLLGKAWDSLNLGVWLQWAEIMPLHSSLQATVSTQRKQNKTTTRTNSKMLSLWISRIVASDRPTMGTFTLQWLFNG